MEVVDAIGTWRMKKLPPKQSLSQQGAPSRPYQRTKQPLWGAQAFASAINMVTELQRKHVLRCSLHSGNYLFLGYLGKILGPVLITIAFFDAPSSMSNPGDVLRSLRPSARPRRGAFAARPRRQRYPNLADRSRGWGPVTRVQQGDGAISEDGEPPSVTDQAGSRTTNNKTNKTKRLAYVRGYSNDNSYHTFKFL